MILIFCYNKNNWKEGVLRKAFLSTKLGRISTGCEAYNEPCEEVAGKAYEYDGTCRRIIVS